MATGVDAIHISTFDEDGDQSALVVVWFGPLGRQHVDIDFADGHVQREPVIATTDGEEVAARLDAIDNFLATKPPLESREAWCLGSIVSAGTCLVGGCQAKMALQRTRLLEVNRVQRRGRSRRRVSHRCGAAAPCRQLSEIWTSRMSHAVPSFGVLSRRSRI